jgi:preprotein translocase subunit Sec61beta
MKKTTRILLFGVFLVGITLIPDIAAASLNPIDWFKSISGGVVNLGITIAYGLPIAGITITLLGIAIVLANLASAFSVLLGHFMDQSLQVLVLPGHPGTIPFVEAGWLFTRNLVNVFLLLIVAITGFATILRFQEYDAKKILPRLILVALLVNFSGVAVAFVVDIANIFTSFFLSKVTNFGLGIDTTLQLLQTTKDGAIDILKGMFNNDPLSFLVKAFTPAANALAIGVFFLLLILVLFVVLLLFIVRIVILWILTILSPIAFAMSVLPATQSLWKQWRTQLFQWAFIGIPMSFFLWLSAIIVKNMGQVEATFGRGTFSGESDLTAVLASFLGPMAAIVTLIVGVSVSMTFAPTFGKTVADFGKKAGIRIGVGAGSAVLRKYGKWPEKGAEKIRAAGQKLERSAQGKGRIFGSLRAGVGKSIGMTGGLIEMATKEVTSQVSISDDARIAKETERAKKLKTPEQKINRIKAQARLGDMSGAIATTKNIIEEDNPEDLQKAKEAGVIDMTLIQKILDGAKERKNPDHYRIIAKGFLSDLAQLVGLTQEGETASIEDMLGSEQIMEIVKRIQPEDLTKNRIPPSAYDPRTEKGAKGFDLISEHADPDNFAAMLKAVRDREQRRAMIQRVVNKGLPYYIENGHENIPTHAISRNAQDEGVFVPWTKQDILKIKAQRTPLTDEQLQGEEDSLRLELGGLPQRGTGVNRRRTKINDRLNDIQREWDYRAIPSDGTQLQTRLEDAERIENRNAQVPQAGRQGRYWEERATNLDDLERTQREVARRKRATKETELKAPDLASIPKIEKGMSQETRGLITRARNENDALAQQNKELKAILESRNVLQKQVQQANETLRTATTENQRLSALTTRTPEQNALFQQSQQLLTNLTDQLRPMTDRLKEMEDIARQHHTRATDTRQRIDNEILGPLNTVLERHRAEKRAERERKKIDQSRKRLQRDI